jgi:hypothetical protein
MAVSVGSAMPTLPVASLAAAALAALALVAPTAAGAAPTQVASGLKHLTFGPELVDGKILYGSFSGVYSFDPATGARSQLKGVPVPFSSSGSDEAEESVKAATCCSYTASSVRQLRISRTRAAWVETDSLTDPADYTTMSSYAVTHARGVKGRRQFAGYSASGGGEPLGCMPALPGGEAEAMGRFALDGDRLAYTASAPPPICSPGAQEQKVIVRDLGSGAAAPGPAMVIGHAPAPAAGAAFDLPQIAGRYVAWVEPPNLIVVYDLDAGAEVFRQAPPASTEVTAMRIDELGTIVFSYLPDGGGAAGTGWESIADPQVHAVGEGTLLAANGGRVLTSRPLATGSGTELTIASLSGDAPARVASFSGHFTRAGSAAVDTNRIAWARSNRRIVRCRPVKSRKCRKHKFVQVVKYAVLTR